MIDLKHLFFFSCIRNEAPKKSIKRALWISLRRLRQKKPNSLSDLRHNDDTAKRNLYFAMIKVGRNVGSFVQKSSCTVGENIHSTRTDWNLAYFEFKYELCWTTLHIIKNIWKLFRPKMVYFGLLVPEHSLFIPSL